MLLGGKITSIWKNDSYFMGAKSYPSLPIVQFTAEYSDFEKSITDNNEKMIYHLSGYGSKYNEAFASYLGESSERYSFSSFYELIKDKIIFASRKELVEKNGEDRVLTCELINTYFSENDKEHYVLEDDHLKWVELNSVINLGTTVFLPLQFVVSNNGNLFKNEKQFMTSAVSTGTASNENMEKAFENAAIEYLQIDSMNLWWYGGVKGKKLDVDMHALLSKFFPHKNEIDDFVNNFEAVFTDISFDKGIDIVVCELFGKKSYVPQYTIGVQGGKGLDHVIYRGFMECIAVLEYSMNIPWMDDKKYRSVRRAGEVIGNLDDNIIMYAKYGKPASVHHDYEFYPENNDSKDYNLINCVKKFSKYAGFLNITIPDFSGLNLEVVRVVIPELMPISLPSYPPYYHPRYKMIGGIKNNVPHPLA